MLFVTPLLFFLQRKVRNIHCEKNLCYKTFYKWVRRGLFVCACSMWEFLIYVNMSSSPSLLFCIYTLYSSVCCLHMVFQNDAWSLVGLYVTLACTVDLQWARMYAICVHVCDHKMIRRKWKVFSNDLQTPVRPVHTSGKSRSQFYHRF